MRGHAGNLRWISAACLLAAGGHQWSKEFGDHKAMGDIALTGFAPDIGMHQWAVGFSDSPSTGSARAVCADGSGRVWMPGGVIADREAELDLGGGPISFDGSGSLGFVAVYDE